MSTIQAARKTWYPGAQPPSYLDGSMAGDFGFDPLRLGANEKALPWYREGELYNGRWAMMAVVGILFTDAVGLPKFWLAGAEKYALDFNTLVIIEVIVFAILEYKRYESFKKVGATGVLGFVPFDPMGMRSEEMELKEVKNGRLAMVAFIGFCSQAAVQGKGPIDCLKDHIADPGHNNAFTSKVGPELTAAVIALAITPIVIEAKNSLSGGEDEEFNPIPFQIRRWRRDIGFWVLGTAC
eukprot:TRINITY_DN6373_c0_g1_i4.p1 TRINITY_DN6373_c0_g1~~TRINITY_DN6373_c0_g1_i4.p1  ORF type:complete len:239 (+),score=40.53 TRINITY_DN6373_c0_g1_i4:174-890(+)